MTYQVIYQDVLTGANITYVEMTSKYEAEKNADNTAKEMAHKMTKLVLSCERAIKGFAAETLSAKKEEIQTYFLSFYRNNMEIIEHEEKDTQDGVEKVGGTI